MGDAMGAKAWWWSIPAIGVALALVGVTLVEVVPLGRSGSAGSSGPRVPVTSSPTAHPGAREAAARYGWGQVVAGDEFNYQGPPDSARWRVYDSPGHAGQGKRRPSAWQVDGAAATVTGDIEGTTGGMAYREGQKHGRWEARMKIDVRARNYHPVILLWPDMTTPECPEVNFAEGTNNTRLAKFFLHYNCEEGGKSRSTTPVDMTRWHNYAVEWTPTHITGYVDGFPYFVDSNRYHLPQVAMHPCIQLDWFPTKAKTKRTTMRVDWIRVYRIPDEAGAA
jgi:hypothetical protein